MIAKFSVSVTRLLWVFLPLIVWAAALPTTQVQLQTYSWKNNVEFSGSIYVENLGSGSQSVVVKYETMYSSASSIAATFSSSVSGSTYQLWSFDTSALGTPGIDYFYIEYTYNSTVYTDNNNGTNYQIVPSLPIPTNGINLENWDYANNTLTGTVNVVNADYSKVLTAYYADASGKWASANAIGGSYVAPISGTVDGTTYEVWSFTGTIGSGGISAFYVEIVEGSTSYYDNNGGANYTISTGTHTVTSHPSPSIPSTPTTTTSSSPLPTVPVQLAYFTYDNYTLSGHITIQNIAYAKTVVVYYSTYDGVFGTTGDSINAGYIASIPNSDYETWSFSEQIGANGIQAFYIAYTVVAQGVTYYDHNGGDNYQVSNGQPRNETGCLGYNLVNTRTKGEETLLNLELNGKGCAVFGTDIPRLTVSIKPYSDNTVRIKIADTAEQRWQIPASVVPEGNFHGSVKQKNYKVSYTSKPFTFKVARLTGEVIFDTNVKGVPSIVFEDQFLQIYSKLPIDANIYGIGDAIDNFRRPPNTTIQTIWARDHPTPFRQNQYGSHPVYYEVRNGKTHAVYLRNSNGMDVGLEPGRIWYRVIGGVFDFYFFLGPTPAEAAAQYFDVIGKPQFIPRWALGFHQCRYGWPNLTTVEGVYKQLTDAGIPIDTMWGDIDYMDAFKDFTYDPVAFAGLPGFVNSLHAKHQRYVLITDPGIANVSSYAPYTTGLAAKVFIKNPDGTNLVGTVWPGTTVYPDWFHPNVSAWWSHAISTFRKTIDFDGIWIDMNEASNFVTPGDAVQPPYHINNDDSQDPLDTNTLSVNALHYGGITEYNAHNLFGHMEGIHTYNALVASRPSERPFILSRSTAASSGRFVNHWLGDNTADFDDIYYSITGILGMNLYGIPHVGSDICGFNGETTEELCNRWIQVGAFYPFSRHHKAIGNPDSYFYLWESVTKSAKTALTIRYTLLPYLYTLHAQASTLGATVFRPLWWEFPSDAATYNVDQQFLLGDGVLISPCITEGATSVSAYFPAGAWYNWYTGVALSSTKAQKLTLDAPLTFVPVHVRGGVIIPAQYPALTTYETNLNGYFLIVALDTKQQATGTLFADDGLSINSPSNTVTFTANYDVITTQTHHSQYHISQVLEEIRVWGYHAKTAPTKLFLNKRPLVGAVIKFNATTSVLDITGFKIDLNNAFTLSWN